MEMKVTEVQEVLVVSVAIKVTFEGRGRIMRVGIDWQKYMAGP